MGLPPRLAQIAAIAMASVAGGTLIAVERDRTPDLDTAPRRVLDRMGFLVPAPKPRKVVTYTHTPEVPSKRAKRRAKGRAK